MARWGYRRRDPVMLELRRREAATEFAQGVRSVEIARRLGVSRAAVSQWRRRWVAGGVAALRAVPHRGRPSPYGAALFGRVGRLLVSPPGSMGQPGDRWTLQTLGRALEARWGVRYSRSGLWRALRARAFLWRPAGRGRTAAKEDPLDPRAGAGWIHRRQVYPPDPRARARAAPVSAARRTKGRRGARLVPAR